MNVHFKMICRVKILLSASLAAGMVALAAPVPPALPLYFEANLGQAESPAQFIAHQRDSQFLISPAGAQIVLHKAGAGLATVGMQFVGANARAQIHGDAELPGKVNYLVGDDPAQWHSGVPTFAKVRVSEIYPGVGVIYYGNLQQLEYDFTVSAGANPDAIAIRFDGAEKISIRDGGELVLTLPGGEIRQPKPVIYQTVDGARREISGGYRLLDALTVGFSVGDYNHSLPLVIDPVLGYSTYFGGNYGETAWAVALDSSNNVYIAGQTFSTRFTNDAVPFSFSTPGAYQTNFHGGLLLGDAFVAKLDNAGSNLIYLTYLGGSADDIANAIAVDGAGNAYIAGFTDSTNFPITNAYSSKIAGQLNVNVGFFPTDAFVTELNTNGSGLVYSTYLGGNAADAAYGIAVDAAGDAYVTGLTASTNFPTSTNALQKQMACLNSLYFNANAFVTELGPNGTKGPYGTNLIYSSFLGGSNYDRGEGIAVDTNGNVYVAGYTSSTNFPTYNYLIETNVTSSQTNVVNGQTNVISGQTNVYEGNLLNGLTNQIPPFKFDAFVAKFTNSCTTLVYCTLLGRTNNDLAFGIACDNAGGAYVTGETTSPLFPNTALGIIPNGLTNGNGSIYGYATITNAFLTKITNGVTGAAGIAYSALFGGTNNISVGWKVALDPAGDAFVVGSTSATNFPTMNTFGYLRATNSGGSDVFVTAFNTNCTAVLYSGLIGGSTNDYGYGIVVDSAGSAYVVGQTTSTNFPVFNARQTALNGSNDVFLAKIIFSSPILTLAANLSGTNVVVSWPPMGQATTNTLGLETVTNLLSTNWTAVPQAPVLTTNLGTNVYDYTFNPTNQMQFFRLYKL